MKPLKKIRMRNFRCFEDFELELHPQLTVLVADNGGGKTSVLDAIAIGLSPILQRLTSANQRLKAKGFKDTDFRVVQIGVGRNGEPKFGASDYTQVVVETIDGLRWDNWKPSAPGVKVPPDKIGLADLHKYLDSIVENQFPGLAANPFQGTHLGEYPVFAYYGTKRALLDIPDRLHPSKVDYSKTASALVGALDAQTNFKECLQWFDAFEAFELRTLKETGMEGDFENNQLGVVRHVIRQILGDGVSNPRFDARTHKLVVESKQPDGHSVVLRVDQLSQGYQAMLALAMDFARRMTLANPDFIDKSDESTIVLGEMPHFAPAIMLVDEIDLHLHPSWQQRVLGDLVRAFPHTQLIVTTHSPQVLTTVKSECIRNLVIDQDGLWIAKQPGEQTKGMESAYVMAAVMKTDPIPPVEEAQWVSDYRALIEDGNPEGSEAQELRAKLVNHFGPDHPLILDFDRLIRFQAFKRQRTRPEEG